MHRLCGILLASATLVACVRNEARTESAAAGFVEQPCATQLVAAHARCGTISVPEDHERPDGRSIALNVIVFPALEPGPEPAAQFDLEGGPGFAVTDSAAFYAVDGEAYRRHRDVVLFDQRGAGRSNPLRCAALEEYAASNPSGPMYPPALVAQCAQQLANVADLRQYGTAAASRDIDAVRVALGYRQIDLNALSYGTTLALRYIADYSGNVRTAVLTGTVPAQRTPPAHHAIAAERGLRELLGACAADPTCHAAFPDPSRDLARATVRLGADAPAFMETLRTLLYLPVTARSVPSFIHATAEGRSPFEAKSGARVFSDGLYLSITCSESIARMDLEQAIAESDATPFGAYRLRRQRDACEEWPTAPRDPDLFRTASSPVPTLFISGALDPVTPPEWTREVAASFPNGRVVVAPEGGHVLEGLSGMDTCMDAVILDFVAAKSASGLDTSCFASMRRGAFAVP